MSALRRLARGALLAALALLVGGTLAGATGLDEPFGYLTGIAVVLAFVWSLTREER